SRERDLDRDERDDARSRRRDSMHGSLQLPDEPHESPHCRSRPVRDASDGYPEAEILLGPRKDPEGRRPTLKGLPYLLPSPRQTRGSKRYGTRSPKTAHYGGQIRGSYEEEGF